jgi:hypothetical protein
MRLSPITLTCLLALTAVACKRESARELEPVTTTGAEVPIAEPAATVPPPQETINQEGDPATARPREIEAVDITGANRDVPGQERFDTKPSAARDGGK